MSVTLAGESSAQFDASTRDKLRLIAKYQRWIMFAILASILSVLLVAVDRIGLFAMGDEALWAFNIFYWCLSLFMLLSIVLLTRQLYTLAMTIVCGVAMFIPGISLLVLLIVNGRATRHLQEHHVKVGLLGANPNMI